MTFILAHDIGTTGDKATLFRPDGSVVASAFVGYPTIHPRPGWCEQDPADWWAAVVASTRELLVGSGIDPREIAVVGFSGHMMGCLAVGDEGSPLGLSMIHSDTRSADVAARVASSDGRRIYEATGNPADSHYPAPKIRWLREHHAEVYAKARWFLQSKDWIAGKLTGRFGLTDHSDASLYGLYDISARRWSEDMAGVWGIESGKLPEIVDAATVIGRVTREASSETGLPEGLPVVIGGGDGACAAVGAGAVGIWDAYCYLGSTAWVASIADRPVIDPDARLFVLSSLDATSFSLIGAIQAAGTSMEWAADTLGGIETERAGLQGSNRFALLDALAEAVPAGSLGLLFLPYLLGERSPMWDPNARGVFFGLGAEHGRAAMVRSVLEGVAYALRSVIDVIEENGVSVSGLGMIGGGASSATWTQVLCDIFRRPISVPGDPRVATSCGAAVAAGIGTGIFDDYSAARLFVEADRVLHPGPNVEVYSRGYELYRSLYPALQSSFASLSRLRDGV